MDTLTLSGTSYAMHQLGAVCTLPDLTDYERRMFQFVQQWRPAQQTYTVYTSGSTGRPSYRVFGWQLAQVCPGQTLNLKKIVVILIFLIIGIIMLTS